MKKFFEIIVGLFTLIVILYVIGMVIGVVGVLFYSIGWVVGWCIHLIVGPNQVFGITFEQFMGIVYLLIGLFGLGKTTVNQEEIKRKIDEGIKLKLKEYRGY